MERSEDRCDKRRFRGFNHSTCKTVLNQLEAVNLRFRKIVVERVTVVKFRVDNRGSDGTSRSDNPIVLVFCRPKTKRYSKIPTESSL